MSENEKDLEKQGEGEEGEEGETDSKPKLTPEQIKGIKQRQFTKLARELGVEVDKPKPGEKEEKKEKDSFDYGEMAYLQAKGVSEDDYPIVLQAIKATGKSLRDVLATKYLQAEIKEAKEIRESKAAIPADNKRAASSTRDDVEYWIAKGEMPPLDQPELRRKVVRAKMKAEESGSKFTSNPVV